MGIRLKPSRNLTAKDRIAIKKGGHAQFVRMRSVLVANKELARRFAELATRLDKKNATNDKAIAAIMSAIRQLMNPPIRRRHGIGFTARLDE